VRPQLLGLLDIEAQLDLGSAQPVAAGLDRQPRRLGGNADAHRDVAVDGDVPLA
jgi:hypothetical protein